LLLLERFYVYGSTCARVKAALSVGKLLGYWNIPYLSFSSIDPQLADKKTHNTLIRMMSPFNHMASALGQICANFSVRLSLSMFSMQCVCVCVSVCVRVRLYHCPYRVLDIVTSSVHGPRILECMRLPPQSLWSPHGIGQTIIFSSCFFFLLLLFFIA